MSTLLQLNTELTGGGGIAKMVALLQQQLQCDESYVGLFDCNAPDYLEVKQVIGLGSQKGNYRTFRMWRSRWKDLRRFKNNTRIDVSISHSFWLHILNVLAGGLDKKILLFHGSVVHNPDVSARTRVLMRLLLKLSNRWTFQIVAVSEELAAELRQNLKLRRKVSHILNFVDVENIIRLAEEKLPDRLQSIFRDFPVLITAGRLHPQKNLGLLIALFASLRKHNAYRHARLIIMGTGDDLKMLMQCAALLQLRAVAMEADDTDLNEADIVFTGFIPNPYPLMRHAALYISTSLYEGFPLAVCEALITGTPVVASDCPTGHTEIICGVNMLLPSSCQQAYGKLLPIKDLNREQVLYAWTTFFTENDVASLLQPSPPHIRESYARRHQDEQLRRWHELLETATGKPWKKRLHEGQNKSGLQHAEQPEISSEPAMV